ncbi:glycosyltransferase [Sunxiuqinia sp. A32]|uniref:glycosyltransferase n=1 Tax=Sunxiuqinia sp. A32 TaxID=3461496 RepID=UPI004045CA30
MSKQIYISVINDLVTDNRVHKVCLTLQKMGFDVTLVGRKLPDSHPIENRSYSTKRMKLIFTKGPAFYIEFNIRLLFLLLFSKADVLLSNDLDTLLANYIASELRNKPLVYDSHEYFTELPELVDRPKVRKTWEQLEKKILPNIKYAYTVCESIANIYRQTYGTPFRVVRNLPLLDSKATIPDDVKLKFGNKKIILYQGALNVGRGLECAIQAMQHIENTQLVIAGDGDIREKLQSLAQTLKLNEKVSFLGKIPLEKMKFITAQADLGLSIEEDMGLNYRFALPNKLFDYIQQEVPGMVSNLPEMKQIVEQYQIGMILEKHDPQVMATQFEQALNNSELRAQWKTNLKNASKELCWENEGKVVQDIFQPLI